MTDRRYLIITPDYYPLNGGYANAASNFVAALSADERTFVKVMTPTELGHSPEIKQSNIRVQRLIHYQGRSGFKSIIDQLLWVRRVRSECAAADWDFVLFETLENPLMQYLVGLFLSNNLRWRMGVRIHGTHAMEGFSRSRKLSDRISWYFVKKVLAQTRNIISTNTHYLDFIRKEVFSDRLPGDKTYGVVSNVVWPVLERDDEDGPHDQIDFLSLGRMGKRGYEQKNFELIARALGLLKKKRGDLMAKIKVHLVGEGKKLADFQQLTADLEVAEAFTYTAQMPHEQVRELQGFVAAVILVSRFEGQSMFALEALAAGAPLILSSGTGVSDLVRLGSETENGFLVDPADALALCTAMIAICDGDRRSMGLASADLYRREYAPEKITRVFHEYVEGTPRPGQRRCEAASARQEIFSMDP